MGTSVKRTTNVHDLSKMGDSYDMPSETVDGMSPEAVCAAIKRAAMRGRKGEGPTLLNIETYRYKGHSMSDPQKYRTKQEVEEYKSEDPIEKVLKTIVDNKFASQAQINKIQDKVKALVDESVEFAENGPNPAADELYDDVYSSEYPFIIE
jgi:pyruvate dehydrogenase E1 component alpha subunit